MKNNNNLLNFLKISIQKIQRKIYLIRQNMNESLCDIFIEHVVEIGSFADSSRRDYNENKPILGICRLGRQFVSPIWTFVCVVFK